MGERVTIYTRVYNTEAYLPQCLNSVINQTYQNFQHLIIDNGCTDGCTEILKDYAKKYSWVKLIRYGENQQSLEYIKWLDTPYFTVLDSDDWWEPDYLERLVGFLENNDLDLAVTGTIQYLEEHGISQIMRKLERPILLTQGGFAQNYPLFWTYPSTVWATLRKTAIFKKIDFTGILGVPYGGDTMQMLRYIKQCTRIGIDNSALYHYRIHPKSVTYQYNPRRFDANIAFYEQVKEFLEYHRTLDAGKREWLKVVHLSSMGATLELLRSARISSEEKLAECIRIIKHPLTETALTHECTERKQWFDSMWNILFASLSDTCRSTQAKLVEILCVLSPDCGKAVQTEDLGLFVRKPALWEALKEGDGKQLANLLLELIAEKRYTKQYDLGAILHRLFPEGSLLQGIEDTRFFREYVGDCAELLRGNNMIALDHMTGLLLNGKKLYAPEQFLDLYLSLAALEDQAPAFIFGKLQLAKLYLQQGKGNECRTILDELTEMGLDNKELFQLRQELGEQP